MYCQSQTLVKWGDQERTGTVLRCRSWNCAECAPDRRRQLIAKCHSGTPNTFLTLTSRRREGMTPDIAAKRLAWCWRLLRLRWMRLKKLKRLPFVAVFEATKLGWPHLHILLRASWIDQKWLSDTMQELDNSPVVSVERIDNRAKINAYVAKYAGGDAHKFGTAKRYWTSQDWTLVLQRPGETPVIIRGRFDRENMPLAKLVSIWRQAGWEVTILSRWRAHVRTGSIVNSQSEAQPPPW